jgi:hypothetical protein
VAKILRLATVAGPRILTAAQEIDISPGEDEVETPERERAEAVFDRLGQRLVLIERRLGAIEERLAGARKEYYRIADLSALVGRSDYSVRRWIKEGLLKATRVAGTGPRGILLVPREQVERLVNSGRVSAIPGVTLRGE